MCYIVDELFIEINIADIRREIVKISECKCLVVKSNFYGYGYKLLDYISDIVDYIVVTDAYEMKLVKAICNNIRNKFIILYGKDLSFKPDIYPIVTSLNQLQLYENSRMSNSNVYMRCDNYLAMHGIEWEICKERIESYKGVFIHINEYLSESELKELLKIDEFLYKKNKILNIGGSEALNYVKILRSDVEYRFAKRVLYDNLQKKSNFILHLPILDIRDANKKEESIGYKSDRKIINMGFLYLVQIGYGDWPTLARIYEKKVMIRYQDKKIELPVYPCMNTAWLWTREKLPLINSEIVLFENKREIIDICQKIDIDMDEFFVTFSEKIHRIYKENYS